ncbi:MAG: hypothetical protein M1814_005299 [Vezdaea aestivalis]|nr:MAG: hypothetical protein M1814_005299 [Vezdaea aestivalis]
MRAHSDQPANGVVHHADDEAEDESAGDTSAATASSNKKRRPPIAQSSRGVANLTPEQLAKKRANDRDAQRAIRIRTRTEIESLKHKIQELTAQQPYQDLQRAERQKEAIRAENEDIKRQLSSIVSMLQPLIGCGLKHEPPPAQWTPTNKYLPPPVDRRSEGRGAPFPLLSPILSQYNPQSPGKSILPSSVKSMVSHLLKANNGSRSTSVSLPRTVTPEALPALQLGYLAAVKTLAPSCILDNVMLDYLDRARAQLRNGRPILEVIGPRYPDITSIVYNKTTERTHSLSEMLSSMINTFPDVSDLPERICTIYMMYILFQWQINPTRESYERMPDWLAPRPSQLFTVHPAWIDNLPWPKMRDSLVYDYRQYTFNEFFPPYTTGLSVNWPYDPMTCVGRGQDGEYMLTGLYEDHIRNLSNWSLGPEFEREFPTLSMSVNIKPKARWRTA